MSNLRFKVGDRAKVVGRKYGHEFEIGTEVEILEAHPQYIVYPYACRSNNGSAWAMSDSELAPIKSFEEKTAKAFEEIANGTGPEMVVISAEEYANFQEMEKLLAKMLTVPVITRIGNYWPEIEKLLKQKYNP